jgi:hypothetical protein
MLTILEYIVNLLKTDATIIGFVSDRIYPTGVDITPENGLFPLITFSTVSEITRTVPVSARDSIYQIDIWSILSQYEVEQITERILTLLNRSQFHTGYGSTVLRWQRQDGANDIFESDRRIWHKALRFRAWETK